jgi:twinkle protein
MDVLNTKPTSKLIERTACPRCREEGHDNHGDNLARYSDGHSYCYRCGYTLYNNLGDLMDDEFTYQFLPIRGLSESTLRFYNISCKCDASGRPLSIGFVYPKGTKVRSFDTKSYHWVGESVAGLFGLDKFAAGAHKSIVITEGELDAASIWQTCKTPAVSVRSASSAATDVGAVRSLVNDYEKIYLGFDNDPAGEAATAAVARLFDYNKVYHLKYSNRKDPNEYLQLGEGDELLNLFYNARRYLPSTIISSFNDFERVLTEPIPKGVPYPFPTLTSMTYGIRPGETVLIKAPEKVGKTAIMHAIEYQLLKETDSNVGAIYIEEGRQRHLQAVAGIELQSPVHLPDHARPPTEILAAVRKVVGRDDRLHIYNHFGTNDPDVILDTIRFLVTARECRYIMFDHISMAVTGLSGEKDERRALEYLASRLEMMVKELNFALIMVTHVNDFGQSRGSHYLTKVSDITIHCARDTMATDGKERRTIRLSIPYNRFCAKTGAAGNLVFDESTYTLREEIPEWSTYSSVSQLTPIPIGSSENLQQVVNG